MINLESELILSTKEFLIYPLFLNTSTNEVINFIAFELSSLNVKFLTCDQRNDIESRLSKRGHKRLMFLDKTDFVNRNFSIQSILIEIYPDYVNLL